tara:strand:+ start:2217 stop:2438 length:222 start_codon:yes stop_codon:yes gene_type:complete
MTSLISQINNLVIDLKKNDPLIKCGNITINILKFLKGLNIDSHTAEILYIESARNWSLQKFRAFQFNKLYSSA